MKQPHTQLALEQSDSGRRQRVRSIHWYNLPIFAAKTISHSLWSRNWKLNRPTLARLKGCLRPNLSRPIFIIGAPRSGTTFLGHAIGQMQGISYHYEPVITKAASRLVYEDSWDAGQLSLLYGSTYRWLMRFYFECGLRFAEKTPRNCFIVPFLAKTFPDSQFLHIVRDGRDAAVSLSEKPWYRSICAGSGLYEPGGYPFGPTAQFWVEPERKIEFETTSDLHRAAWTWRRGTELALEASSSLPPDRYFRVRYEDIVARPSKEAERILDYLRIDAEADRLALRAALGKAQPHRTQRWKTLLSPAEVSEVEREAGDLLRRLGYLDSEATAVPTVSNEKAILGAVATDPRIRSRGLRILMIAPYPVLPPSTGGKIRIVRIAEALAKLGLQVTVLTPFKPGQRGHAHEVSFELRQVVYPYVLPLLFTDRPFPYMYLVSQHPAFATRIRGWLRTFDLVQFEHASFADLLHYLPRNRPVVYDAHNVEFDYVRQETKSALVRRIVDRRIHRFERALVDSSSLVLATSSEDRDRLEKLYGLDTRKVLIVPNGIRSPVPPCTSQSPTPPWPDRIARLPRKAIFSGSDVVHNRKAVELIVNEVAPRLRQTCGFVIQGECGRAFSRNGDENVYFDLDWNAFEQYVRPGVVGLNPMTQGSGTNLKLVHYLAHGMPVLSTEFGVRGFEELAPLVHVRAPHDFAEALRGESFEPPQVGDRLRPLLWETLAVGLRDAYLQLIDRSRNDCRERGSCATLATPRVFGQSTS